MTELVESEPTGTPDESSKPSCFTIMPFGGWRDRYYEEVFKPAIEDRWLVSTPSRRSFRPGTIINDIWMFTKQADVLLDDLTGQNGNVLYELGLAHAIAKPVLIVSESVEDIPFDLRSLRIIEYNKESPRWGEILKEGITQGLSEIADEPLSSVLPTFLNVKEDAQSTSVSPAQRDLLELRSDIDILRREFRTLDSPVRSRGRLLDEDFDEISGGARNYGSGGGGEGYCSLARG